jgi:hypothetical protein
MESFAKAVAFSGMVLDESLPITTWLAKYYPYAHNLMLECTQEAGDVIFIPHGYMHAVINTKDSIGLANQVREAHSERWPEQPACLRRVVLIECRRLTVCLPFLLAAATAQIGGNANLFNELMLRLLPDAARNEAVRLGLYDRVNQSNGAVEARPQ